MEYVAVDGCLERGNVEGVVDGNHVGRGFLVADHRFDSVESATRGITMKWEDPVVRRYNGQRAMRAQCNNAPGYTAESARSLLLPKIDEIALPEGYAMQWLGEHKASGDSHALSVCQYPVGGDLDDRDSNHVVKDFKNRLLYFVVCRWRQSVSCWGC